MKIVMSTLTNMSSWSVDMALSNENCHVYTH